jgi:hypothetical protein
MRHEQEAKVGPTRARFPHIWMVPIQIGDRACNLRRPVLRRHEVAFFLECPENEVRNMQRRGERLRARGLNDEEIVARGALPVSKAGRAWGVRPQSLALQERVASRPLALEMLRSLVSGCLRVPKAAESDQLPPALIERSNRL